MEQANPAITKIRRKLMSQLIFGSVIAIGIIYAIYRTVLSGRPVAEILASTPPIAKIIAGIVLLILLLHIFRLIRDYVKMSKLVPLMQSLANSYGLTYSAEGQGHPQGIEQPLLGVVSGTLQKVKVYVFQALEYVGRRNSPPKKLTIFQAELPASWPPFSVQKKSFLASLFMGLVGGIEHKSKFLIFPQHVAGESKEEKLSKILAVLSDDLLQDFESLPGSNELIAGGELITIKHGGFIYDETDYGPFLSLLSKLK